MEKVTNILADDFFSEGEVASFIGISISTLRGRIATGTEHPPYKQFSRGVYWYPKREFKEWTHARPSKSQVRYVS